MATLARAKPTLLQHAVGHQQDRECLVQSIHHSDPWKWTHTPVLDGHMATRTQPQRARTYPDSTRLEEESHSGVWTAGQCMEARTTKNFHKSANRGVHHVMAPGDADTTIRATQHNHMAFHDK
jgi:hypothetical protein